MDKMTLKDIIFRLYGYFAIRELNQKVLNQRLRDDNVKAKLATSKTTVAGCPALIKHSGELELSDYTLDKDDRTNIACNLF